MHFMVFGEVELAILDGGHRAWQAAMLGDHHGCGCGRGACQVHHA